MKINNVRFDKILSRKRGVDIHYIATWPKGHSRENVCVMCGEWTDDALMHHECAVAAGVLEAE